jgi:transcriptional regulator with XRE-family HTH domain
MSHESPSICDRLQAVRVRHYGERGRSRLCRELGITPSTYALYEVSRVPPVELLIRVAQLTGVSMEWLLTGAGGGEAESVAPAEATLGGAAKVTSTKSTPPARKRPVATPPAIAHWIPIVGSTAAGTARFWEELPVTHGGPEADARLEKTLIEYAARAGETSTTPGDLSATSDINRAVSLVQFSTPDDRGFVEFLSAPGVKGKYPRAVAWRIDGDSMSPRYLDGDLVITSLEHPAVTGHPCVARQKGQIGVNCKIYQESGRDVLLIPINERSSTQRFPARQIMWAHRVLCSVRIGREAKEVPS